MIVTTIDIFIVINTCSQAWRTAAAAGDSDGAAGGPCGMRRPRQRGGAARERARTHLLSSNYYQITVKLL